MGFGRNPEKCTYAVTINDGIISRNHFIIERKGGKFVIRDNGSKNGTFVNCQPLSSERILNNGDLIEICGHFFSFSDNTLSTQDIKILNMDGQKQVQDAVPAILKLMVLYQLKRNEAVRLFKQAVSTGTEMIHASSQKDGSLVLNLEKTHKPYIMGLYPADLEADQVFCPHKEANMPNTNITDRSIITPSRHGSIDPQHAVLFRNDEDGLTIYDNFSKFGTCVNGETLKQGGSCKLKHGDNVKLGGNGEKKFTFEVGENFELIIKNPKDAGQMAKGYIIPVNGFSNLGLDEQSSDDKK